jgi:signal transduction histidine kinase
MKILAVDDIDKNLEVIGNILGEKGFTVSLANSGKQAIKIAKRMLPDLILLDINMPEMDGYQTCWILKNDEQTSHIPVIFLSALSEKESIVKGLELGGVDYISKPFNKAELLARVNTHLELKYAKDQLNQRNEELQEANATKDKFFNIIAHDLKSPFSSILGFTDLLIQNIEKYDHARIKQFITSINESGKNTYKLIENLLEWARSQQDKIPFKPTQNNLYYLIYEPYMLVIGSASNKKITIDLEVDKEIELVADSEMMKTIIRNVVSNAIKYTPENGKITISGTQVNDEVIINITDTGVGMSDQIKHSLFKIGETQSMIGTNGENGTGFGLLLCKEFVEKHRGKIKVESELGKGSKFIITIPAR